MVEMGELMLHVDHELSGTRFNTKLRDSRVGIMLHDDGSASDAGGMSWFVDPRNRSASYNFLILDNGDRVQVVPQTARAWHAGVCRPTDMFTYKDANSAFYGVATAASKGDGLTEEQLGGVISVCTDIFEQEDWSFDEVWRITGHKNQAWPRGRKDDPYNYRVRAIRLAVQRHALELDPPSMAHTLKVIKADYASAS